MNLTRSGLVVSIIITCFTYVKTFVIMDSQSKDPELREKDVIYLLKLLKGLEPITADDVNDDVPHNEKHDVITEHEHAVRDAFVSNKNHHKETEEIQPWVPARSTGHNSSERNIHIEKKDYAILPPATEWCRMMGFRQCGKNRSRR